MSRLFERYSVLRNWSLALLGLTLLVPVSHAEETELAPWSKKGIKEFHFVDQTGKPIERKDLKGTPWIVGFIFTRCAGPCPRVTAQMRLLREQTNVRTVTITVDPDFDTPEVLARYAQTFGGTKPDDKTPWLFLSGKQNDTYILIRDSFKVPVVEMRGEDRKPGFEVLHSTNIMLVNENLQVVAKFNALKDEEVAKLRRILQKKAPFPPPPTGDDKAELIPGFRLERSDGSKLELAPPAGSQQDDQSHTPSSGATQSNSSQIPAWALKLPTVNATLNGLSLVLLVTGFILIKQRRTLAHRNAMLLAFSVSILFLACYLVYHFYVPSRRFTGVGGWRTLYFVILSTHVVLAATVPILAGRVIWLASQQRWTQHKALAVITFPIWVYVSATGVIIYLMLYHWPKNA